MNFTPVVFYFDTCYRPMICVWTKANELAYRYQYVWEEPVDTMAEKLSKHYGAVRIKHQFSYWQQKELMQNIDLLDVRINGFWKIVAINNIAGPLYIIQSEARKEDIWRTQDVHSNDFKTWIEERSRFYNNGFYEYAQSHNINTQSMKMVSDIINHRYEELFACTEHTSEKYSGCYSEDNSSFIIAKYKDKYIVYGTGADECGSDWLDYYIFFVYDKLEDVKELQRTTVHKRPTSGTDVTKLYNFCAQHKIQL